MTTTADALQFLPTSEHFTPEQVARIAWSHLIEPGDAYAGILIENHGAEHALALALHKVVASIYTSDIDRLGALRDRLRPLDVAAINATLQSILDNAHTVLIPSDPAWPTRLNDLGTDAPYVLYIDGNARALVTGTEHTAVIGSILSTEYGNWAAVEIASGLVERGHAIYGTGYLGISGAAHRIALASRGRTVGVLSRGLALNNGTEAQERHFARLSESGALVTEYPPLTTPTLTRALRRNQLLAAISNSTVVIEASGSSKSLSGAIYAATIGRPVGAMPGPITSLKSEGTHALLREHGATLITSAEHVHALTNP